MWQSLVSDFPAFMEKVNNFIHDLSIDVDDLPIDHIALRMKNTADVAKLASELVGVGVKIADAVVNERRICIFKLHEPLQYQGKDIYCIELPYPAADHRYPLDGWEHVEFVLKGSTPPTLEADFSDRFPSVDAITREKYNFRITTPDVKNEALVNTTIVLQKSPGLSIKFHCYSIEQIVES